MAKKSVKEPAMEVKSKSSSLKAKVKAKVKDDAKKVRSKMKKDVMIMSADDIALSYQEAKYSMEALKSIASVTGCELAQVIDQLKSVGFEFGRGNKLKTIPVKYMNVDVVADQEGPVPDGNEYADMTQRKYSVRFDVIPKVYVHRGHPPISELERPLYKGSDGYMHVDYSEKCPAWI